jgi:hypothetical protein
MPAEVSTPTQMIIRELKRFLENDEPGVIAIRGRWGVGKTYAWNEAIKAAVKSGTIKYDCYSSVSLFGIESLEKLKFAVFENRTYGEAMEDEPDVESLAKSWGTIGAKILAVAGGSGASDLFQAGAFVTVRKQIICIDDIERKGKDLRTMDVLGLASFLRERRCCKVVLILNDEQLEEEKSEFAKYQEKVIDSSYLFAPTPVECADIGLNDNNKFGAELKRRCIALGIENIRVIKKIEGMLFKIYPILKDYDKRILDSAIATLALFGWAHFGEHESIQPKSQGEKTQRNLNEELMTFITDMYGKGLYGTTTKVTPDEERWAAMLKAYEFGSPDALDALLYEGLRKGYFDEDKIAEQAKIMMDSLAKGAAREAWNKAWDLFHNSFDDNETAVVDALRESFAALVKQVSAGDLNIVMRVFKQLGRNEVAQEALDLFIKEHDGGPEFFELEENIFNQQIDDPDLRRAFAQKAIGLREAPEPQEILLRMYRDHAWSPSDVQVLKELPVDGYYDLFKMPLGDDHRRIIASALSFREYANPQAEYVTIVEKAVEALKRIGKENGLNRIRVQSYGVSVDDDK